MTIMEVWSLHLTHIYFASGLEEAIQKGLHYMLSYSGDLGGRARYFGEGPEYRQYHCLEYFWYEGILVPACHYLASSANYPIQRCFPFVIFCSIV